MIWAERFLRRSQSQLINLKEKSRGKLSSSIAFFGSVLLLFLSFYGSQFSGVWNFLWRFALNFRYFAVAFGGERKTNTRHLMHSSGENRRRRKSLNLCHRSNASRGGSGTRNKGGNIEKWHTLLAFPNNERGEIEGNISENRLPEHSKELFFCLCN